MKDVANRIDLAPSVLSALYATVLPDYCQELEISGHYDALEHALAQVNNISKKRLLSKLDSILEQLADFNPEIKIKESSHPFIHQLLSEMNHRSTQKSHLEGIYLGYSISSSEEAMKIEPYRIFRSENASQLGIARKSVFGAMHEGLGILQKHQVLYGLFNEVQEPDFALVSLYLQLPFSEKPSMLKGLYMSLDYNKNPIARRIVLIKVSDETSPEAYEAHEARLVLGNEISPEEKVYFDYSCERSDSLRMCAIPAPKMDERDLISEKKCLSEWF